MSIPRHPLLGTHGGQLSATLWSGIIAAPGLAGASGAVAFGSDVLLQSGQGRLNTVLPFAAATSGVAVVFYDAAICSSGGPFANSGHKVLYTINPWPQLAGASGQTPPALPVQVDVPFLQNLCVAARSGAPSFTATWTPEP